MSSVDIAQNTVKIQLVATQRNFPRKTIKRPTMTPKREAELFEQLDWQGMKAVMTVKRILGGTLVAVKRTSV